MFNGIIYHTGEIHFINKKRNSILVGIKSKLKLKSKDIGSSICCNGVCLTLEKIKSNISFFYISQETIKKTNCKNLKKGQKINLEKS